MNASIKIIFPTSNCSSSSSRRALRAGSSVWLERACISSSYSYPATTRNNIGRLSTSRWYSWTAASVCRTTRSSEYYHGTSSTTARQQRWFSAATSTTTATDTVSLLSKTDQPIRILYASQGGTAQLFAQQLAEGLEELDLDPQIVVSIEGWHEYPKNESPSTLLQPGQGLHVFLCSVTGVGDAPNNGRAFYEWVSSQRTMEGRHDDSSLLLSGLEYTVFGLGNSKAHPNHYNVIGIDLDQRLEMLGASRIFPLGLGDDGDCIEDDFDQWLEQFLTLLKQGGRSISAAADATEDSESRDDSLTEAADSILDVSISTSDTIESRLLQEVECPAGVAISDDGRRVVSAKYPTLQLKTPETDVIRHNLFHLQGTPQAFYKDGTVSAKVVTSRSLSAHGAESGLREIVVQRSSSSHEKSTTAATTTTTPLTYTTGDHLLVYPENAHSVVQTLLETLDVHPHAIIEGTVEEANQAKYPFPRGLTVAETLRHCVDLGALPSPAFSRFLMGRKDVDYKREVANPRRTVLDMLLQEASGRISLEDLLYNLTPMKSRYYSIASSSRKRPEEVLLTYRPVRYITSRGGLREGVCTSYLASMGVLEPPQEDEDFINRTNILSDDRQLSIAVNHNPSFRLPKDPEAPILLIAGGCGVAPIRAFIEERIALKDVDGIQSFGPAQLFLGFRNPDDQVYQNLVEQALTKGVLSDAKVAYSSGCTSDSQYCMNVNKLVSAESQYVWDHLEAGGYTYLCGGARTFGAAIEQELLAILQYHGKMDMKGAEQYLRNLLEAGRLLEDLAD